METVSHKMAELFVDKLHTLGMESEVVDVAVGEHLLRSEFNFNPERCYTTEILKELLDERYERFPLVRSHGDYKVQYFVKAFSGSRDDNDEDHMERRIDKVVSTEKGFIFGVDLYQVKVPKMPPTIEGKMITFGRFIEFLADRIRQDGHTCEVIDQVKLPHWRGYISVFGSLKLDTVNDLVEDTYQRNFKVDSGSKKYVLSLKQQSVMMDHYQISIQYEFGEVV